MKMSDLFVKVKEKRDTTSNALNKSFCYILTLLPSSWRKRCVCMSVLAGQERGKRIRIFCLERARDRLM